MFSLYIEWMQCSQMPMWKRVVSTLQLGYDYITKIFDCSCYRCGSKARNHVCVRRCHNINQAELKRIRRINMHRSQ